ncbi:MAG: hypothetical protein ACK44A_03635 [Roseateles sp.]
MSLATIIQLVHDKLRSDALGDLVSTDLVSRVVAQALVHYSTDKPRELTADTTADGDQVPVPPEWVEGVSKLTAVEYPVGEAPMQTLAAAPARPWGGAVRIVLQERSLPTATPVRLHFTTTHASDASTVPAAHENAVACWAAAELCRQAATRAGHDRDATISAANTNQSSQSGDLARRAKDWLAQYRTELGLPDPDAKASGKPAGTVVTPAGDGHRRGRHTSLGA